MKRGQTHPRHQQRHEEQQGDLGVPPRRPVRVHGNPVLAVLHRHHAGMGRHRRPGCHRRGHDVDGILLVVFPRRGTSLAAVLAARGRETFPRCVHGCKLARHQHVGGLEAIEWIKVCGGVECAELLAFLEEFAAGDGIECEGR